MRIILLAAVLALWAGAGAASAGEIDDFNKVRRHFINGHATSFARDARAVAADNVYYPLVSYWAAALDLQRGRPAPLENLRRESESHYVRERAARTLAEHYMRAGAQADFAAVADVSPCATLLAAIHARKTGAAAVRAMWRGEQDFRDPICINAYRHARRDGMLTENDMREKLHGLAGSRLLVSSRRFLRHFPISGLSYRAVRKVVLRAGRHIRGKHSLATPANRSLVMIAAMAAAKHDSALSARRWAAFSRYFNDGENNQVWAKIAEHAARAHRREAMMLYRRAPSFANYDENMRAWRVRAALVAGDYADVVRTVQQMPAAESSLSAWRYWRAAALAHTGDRAESEKQMRALAAAEDDYYGLLARESLGIPFVREDSESPVAEAARGDFALALAVRRAGQPRLARQIWTSAIAHSAPSDILAAAGAADAAGWYLASINAANAAGAPPAHAWRYPTPYRDTIEKYSDKFGLEEAFVYALIRRESRFMPDAISSAKARGLMQVLPSTAKTVARRHGYSRYRLSRLTRVDTNVIIGVTYLRDLGRQFGAHPAQVAAAYNAGPGRAKKWRRNINDTLALVENIPFRETRLYVKALLAARAHYALRFGAPSASIRELIDREIFVPQTALVN